jgi:hypothetical protein
LRRLGKWGKLRARHATGSPVMNEPEMRAGDALIVVDLQNDI